MATVKAFSDLEQSKKLAEILPFESTDMVYVHTVDLEGDEHYDIDFRNNQPLFEDDISAWSLAALLGVLPKIGAEEPMVRKLYYASKPVERYICEYGLTNMTSEYDNPVDACYEMVLKLHELKIL